MSHSYPPYSGSSFAHRDLRNRSFRGQALNGADFTGADIRGCDFSQAQLVNANFQQVRAGLSRRQRWMHRTVAIVTLVLMSNIVSQLVFSSLGQTMDDRAWRLVIALYGVLALAGLGAAVKFLTIQSWTGKHRCGHRAGVASSVLSAALIGFFYAGSSSGNNATLAVVGALVGAGVAVWAHLRHSGSDLHIATAAAGAVCAYGLSFWVGSIAIALLSVHRLIWGSLISLLTLLCLWLTLTCCRLLLREIRQAIGTSFRGADLTHAQFDAATLRNTDFSQAISRG